MMKIAEVRKKTPEELKVKLMELKREMMNLRFQKTSGQLEKTAQFRVVRREVARFKTVLNETHHKASS
jgi:large subunit ribosomal protein L29